MLIPTGAPQYLDYLDDRVAGQRFGLVGLGPALLQVFEAGLPADYLTYQWPVLLLAAFECPGFSLIAAALVARGKRYDAGGPDLAGRRSGCRRIPLPAPTLLSYGLGGAAPGGAGGCLSLCGSRPAAAGAAWTLILVSLVTAAFLLGQVVGPLAYLNTAAFAGPLIGLPLLVAFIVALAAGRDLEPPRPQRLSGWAAGLPGCGAGGLYAAGILQTQPALANIASTLAGTLPPDAVVTGRLAGTMALAAPPLDGVPMLDNISLRSVETMVARARCGYSFCEATVRGSPRRSSLTWCWRSRSRWTTAAISAGSKCIALIRSEPV